MLLATLTPIFDWNSVSGATGYGLYIRDVTANTLIFNNDGGAKTGTAFTLPSGYLSNNGHAYRWAMTSFTGASESAQSSYLYFQAPTSVGPSLVIVSPNGGQNWTAGTAQTISWTVNGTPNPPINYFGMNYSLNGGTS